MTPQPKLVEYLRVERRSYLWGSILVLLIVSAAQAALLLMHLPHGSLLSMFGGNQSFVQQEKNFLALRDRVIEQHQIAFLLLSLSGALATLILNLRISMLINRPRGAFGPDSRTGMRWSWLLFLAAAPVLVPYVEIAIIVVLTRWASQEIRARSAAGPAGPGPAQAAS